MGNAAEALEPRIYVACVAAYNNGQLHGVWISVRDDADAVREEDPSGEHRPTVRPDGEEQAA